MIIFKKAEDINRFIQGYSNVKSIGFIPTMGALHQGHLSLIKQAKSKNDFVVCSIFINPTQFNDNSDFKNYPVTIEKDIKLIMSEACDLLFLPSIEEIYPNGTVVENKYDFAFLTNILEGKYRIGHFDGVTQVVSKLLNIIKPQALYLGQKDYQQCMVIKKLLAYEGLDNKIQLEICPTIREPNGLAMSSRNLRLSETQRKLSDLIYKCLISISNKNGVNHFQKVKKECIELLKENGFEPDYVELANAENLCLLDEYDTTYPMIALIAAKIGEIRLIDNMMIS